MTHDGQKQHLQRRGWVPRCNVQVANRMDVAHPIDQDISQAEDKSKGYRTELPADSLLRRRLDRFEDKHGET